MTPTLVPELDLPCLSAPLVVVAVGTFCAELQVFMATLTSVGESDKKLVYTGDLHCVRFRPGPSA
jgi:hypothetical protein